MTDINQDDVDTNAAKAQARWGINLRATVQAMSVEHTLCEACIWEQLLLNTDERDPAVALAKVIGFLNEERAADMSFIFASIFGGDGLTIMKPASLGKTELPTPGPLTVSDKKAILRAAGYAPVLDQELGAWVADDTPLIDSGFSGSMAWQAAWEFFLTEEEVYRHYKGGVYIRGCDGRSSEGEIVVYEHVWPHEPEIWVRPKAEFEEEGRFVRVTV